MSNIKKCLILKILKNQNRDNYCKKSKAFLLLEFVVTLGVMVLSITIIVNLMHSIAQTQQAILHRSKLIDDMDKLNLNYLPEGASEAQVANRVVHHRHIQLIFDAKAHAAWSQRWKGKSLLSKQVFRFQVREIELHGGKIPVSMRYMRSYGDEQSVTSSLFVD